MKNKEIKLNEELWEDDPYSVSDIREEDRDTLIFNNVNAIEDLLFKAEKEGDKKDFAFDILTYDQNEGITLPETYTEEDDAEFAQDIIDELSKDYDLEGIELEYIPRELKLLIKYIDNNDKTESLKEGKVITQYVHYDDEGLPTAIADTMEQLANLLGVEKSAISLAIKRGSESYAKVQYDEDDEFEDIDLSKLKDVQDTYEVLNKVNK
jgi:hypothetical protein